jgi:branched-chain amino acid transport system substrate-binding protein
MWLATGAAALAVGVGTSACGSAQRVTTTTPHKVGKPSHVIDIYSSLPLIGPQGFEGRAIQRGIELGLAQGEEPAGQIGEFKVNFEPRNDADKDGWTQTKVEGNAESAARDPRAVLYIGDLDSGATEISLPILNQAGVVQITPGSGYIGLTDQVTGVTKGSEPKGFYPTGIYSLLRLIPDDMVQAAAALDALSALPASCQRVTAISFGSPLDGPALVRAIQVTTKDYRMTYVPGRLTSGTSSAELTYAEDLKRQTVQCLVVAGRPTAEAVSLVKMFHAELPTDPILATSGLCNQQFTNPHDGGLPAVLDPYVSCISPVLPLSRYGALARTFIADYRAKFRHQTPGPYSAYGYVAGELAAIAIDTLDFSPPDNREAVQTALLGGEEHESELLGELIFDAHGDLLSRRVGLFRIEDGVPVLRSVLTPPKVFGPG